MTTIVWNNARLVSDTRITYLNNDDGVLSTKDIADDCDKIVAPNNLTCNGRKVLAIGCTGNAATISFLKHRDQSVDEMLRAGFFELTEAERLIPTCLIIITIGRNYTIEIKDGACNWVEYDPRTPLAAGSGTPFIANMFADVTPELAVTTAIEHDLISGGSLNVWSLCGGSKLVKPVAFLLKQRIAISKAFCAFRAGFAAERMRHQYAILENTI